MDPNPGKTVSKFVLIKLVSHHFSLSENLPKKKKERKVKTGFRRNAHSRETSLKFKCFLYDMKYCVESDVDKNLHYWAASTPTHSQGISTNMSILFTFRRELLNQVYLDVVEPIS